MNNNLRNSVSRSQLVDTGLPRAMVQGCFGPLPDRPVSLFLTDVVRISNGTFGIVYKANLYVYPVGQKKKESANPSSTPQTPQLVAVKKVFQDKRYKNRELQIARLLEHPNIVNLKYYFKTMEGQNLYLGLVLEYFPSTLYQISRENQNNRNISEATLKSYALQLLSGLSYIHSLQICHRDIKPHNVLVDSTKTILKICDFGSAKRLVENESSVAYICSRHYRAPELILGNTFYDFNIDVWSVGCVLSEVILGKVLFVGETSVDQLTQIIKVLGTPSKELIEKIAPSNSSFTIPNVVPKTLKAVLKCDYFQFVILLEFMLSFSPYDRPSSCSLLSYYYLNEK